MVPIRHTLITVRQLVWKPEKNEWLKHKRDLSFEQIEEAISTGGLKGVVMNRNHIQQIIMAVMLKNYVVAVLATVQPTLIILWTAYYSRKLNKYYGDK